MKKNNIKTKIIAAVLSAITVFSVGAMTTTTAFAAETHISTGTDITTNNKIVMNDDMRALTKITSETIFKALEATPYGKFVTPLLSGLLDAFIETPEDRIENKLDQLNDKIDKMFSKMDSAEASIKAEMTNDLGVQSFYDTFIKFKAQTEEMNKKIKEVYTSNLKNADKIAKIGSLTGTYSEWRAKFEEVLVELNNFFKKPSMTKDGNIFELAYNHYTNSVMFSGEALDKAKPVCNYVMQAYAAGCATLMESLSAQLCYNKLSDAEKKDVNAEYTAHICKNADDIVNEIKTVSKFLASENNAKNADTFKAMYDKVFGMDRTIFVNKGHDNIVLNKELKVHNHASAIANGKYDKDADTKVSKEFNGLLDKFALNLDQAKVIADYAAGKGITVRKLLESNGFNTSALPQNANLVTAKAYDDSVCQLSRVTGYNYIKAYYKGVNIDAKGAGEGTVQLLDCGYNKWTVSEWNRMIEGNACILQVK